MDDALKRLTRRYGNVSPEALTAVLDPLLVPIKNIDRNVHRVAGQQHWRASFQITIDPRHDQILVPGRTGKFVPAAHVDSGGLWKEIAKGRLTQIDELEGVAHGEVYVGSSTRAALEKALDSLDERDFWEVDQYGASAKLLSGLTEYYLVKKLHSEGFTVRRMPEDVARHINAYYYYDFAIIKEGKRRRLEVKSLWGTDTRYARLIHSKSKSHITSSCKFDTQDYFAVSLFLRTGNLEDFAFAKSVSRQIDSTCGLPMSSKHSDYVHQNPACDVGNGMWFASLSDIWE